MDPRILKLSYSSLLTLHTCPRKYQLYKLNSQEENVDLDGTTNITFAFGHVVGEGIQNVLIGKTEEEIIFKLFLGWHADLEARNEKQIKSVYHAILAVQKFNSLREFGLFEDYELVYYEDKPAVELSFSVSLPNGFVYRGYVDAVLRHKITGKVVVLECKTSSVGNIYPATYKNSSQAIGYSVVLDTIFPDISSYEVIYLVYKTKSMEYETLAFTKSYLQRALWIQELLLDSEQILKYENTGVYPMHGENCMSFFRECEYLNLCTLDTCNLIQPYNKPETEETFQINVTLNNLIEAQVRKSND